MVRIFCTEWEVSFLHFDTIEKTAVYAETCACGIMLADCPCPLLAPSPCWEHLLVMIFGVKRPNFTSTRPVGPSLSTVKFRKILLTAPLIAEPCSRPYVWPSPCRAPRWWWPPPARRRRGRRPPWGSRGRGRWSACRDSAPAPRPQSWSPPSAWRSSSRWPLSSRRVTRPRRWRSVWSSVCNL